MTNWTMTAMQRLILRIKTAKMENKMENKKSIKKGLLICFLSVMLILIAVVPKEIIEKPSIAGHVSAAVRIKSSNLPSFDFNLTGHSINQSSAFFLDVNCSDLDFGDIIKYYDNFTAFEINSTTGIINQTNFNQSFVGNNTVNITCSDSIFNASQVFILTVLDVNEQPNLSSIGPQIATEGV